MEADIQTRAPAAKPRGRGWRALTANCGSVTLWLGATGGEGLPKPAAQCMHLGLPCEKHQDAACGENAASHLANLSLQECLLRGGTSSQGNRYRVGRNQLPQTSRVVRGT